MPIITGFGLCVSIHAPAKGATICHSMLAITRLFQSTLPRRERRVARRKIHCWTWVSIHAPAKGATDMALDSIGVYYVSIHAPAKGATELLCRIAQEEYVSIHAPAKGATWTISFGFLTGTSFNPRSREGSDFHCFHNFVILLQFQSTLPRRERPIDPGIFSSVYVFQSTLPRRERRRKSATTSPFSSFQSTLPRRERPSFPVL